MMALLFAALPPEQRQQLLDETASLAADRVSLMEGVLHGSGGKASVQPLPLAYGLLQALRLMLEQTRVLAERDGMTNSGKIEASNDCTRTYQDVADISSRAIKTSLSIIADLKKDGDEDEMATEASTKPATPLNVNTGAIGANAVYSSIKGGDREAEEQRYALQRVVIGAWLLTKEACATLATAVTDHPSSPPAPLVESAGSLLISAMVSLKHQGAAFAAHNALQRISLTCNSFEELLSFPEKWAKRIIHEISSNETVRDSTLRRSTGFSLGLLSLMRTEPSLSTSSSGLCQHVIAEIIRYSLPSSTVMSENLQKWTASGESIESTFVYPSLTSVGWPLSSTFVNDDGYEVRLEVRFAFA